MTAMMTMNSGLGANGSIERRPKTAKGDAVRQDALYKLADASGRQIATLPGAFREKDCADLSLRAAFTIARAVNLNQMSRKEANRVASVEIDPVNGGEATTIRRIDMLDAVASERRRIESAMSHLPDDSQRRANGQIVLELFGTNPQ